MCYLCSGYKGADQLCSYCTADLHLCFRIGKNPVSLDAAHFMLKCDTKGGEDSGSVLVTLDSKLSSLQDFASTIFFHLAHGEDQLSSNCTADQRLCFRYSDSTISLLPKSEISYFQPSSVTAQAGLCQTWTETPKTGFLMTRFRHY